MAVPPHPISSCLAGGVGTSTEGWVRVRVIDITRSGSGSLPFPTPLSMRIMQRYFPASGRNAVRYTRAVTHGGTVIDGTAPVPLKTCVSTDALAFASGDGTRKS